MRHRSQYPDLHSVLEVLARREHLLAMASTQTHRRFNSKVKHTEIYKLFGHARYGDLGAKERGFGADSVQKYEDSETKIHLPQVRSLSRPVLSLARPCHLPGQTFAAFA
ncbi:hypothetical protein MTR_2g050120 [Medicago truncatula]|uniref:Uncharacterized protein n=1 Tax=Medicago truncatula TaxID=3880 RepID=A0A072V8J7_MEDTR|nr:hypothetical protein MTR_2g050120 [Medicago truncatula]